MRKGENRKAIDRLELSLKHEESTVDEQRKTLQLVCELYFKEKSFKECLETGQKLKAAYWGVEKDVSHNCLSPWAHIIKLRYIISVHMIGHFRVALNLIMKARLSAKFVL